jgi:hypothetical protein
MPVIEPLFKQEQSFLLRLVDSLKRTALGDSLSDDQKYLIRFDKPFEQTNLELTYSN